MKVKTLLAVLALLLPALVSGQASPNQIELNVEGRDITRNLDVTFYNVRPYEDGSGAFLVVKYSDSEQSTKMVWNSLKNIDFRPVSIEQFWQTEGLRSRVYSGLLRNGLQNDRRETMKTFMDDYLGNIDNNSYFIDNYLESRLFELLRDVYPPKLTDGRAGVLNIRIISDLTPDAWIGPDGTMIMTTGILTILNSEDELVALMAQESAHLFLDHQLTNFNRLVANYFEPDLSSVILYSRQQEENADECAAELMKFYGKDPATMASILSKVKTYAEKTGETSDIIGETGSFPYIEERIKKIGLSQSFSSPEYDKMIANVVTHNAWAAFNKGEYYACKVLVDRNIASGTALEDDFLLNADVLIRLYNTPDKNEEALSNVYRAKEAAKVQSSAVLKQEALVLLRMDRKAEALSCLKQCAAILENDYRQYSGMEGDWSQMLNYISTESEWVKRMLKQVGE